METLLIVEDNPPVQRAIQRVFEADGFKVRVASDGISGLEAFRQWPTDAVVLDLMLPGISGHQLCREFKSLCSRVAIVVVSANSELTERLHVLELGADEYVSKPFSPRELVACVRQVMRRLLLVRENASSSTPNPMD
jgi:DNA-binding response OmpR family regulator